MDPEFSTPTLMLGMVPLLACSGIVSVTPTITCLPHCPILRNDWNTSSSIGTRSTRLVRDAPLWQRSRHSIIGRCADDGVQGPHVRPARWGLTGDARPEGSRLPPPGPAARSILRARAGGP